MLCRFLHASDFGLDLPVEGCLDLPDAMEARLLVASRRAVERVIDAAILEDVDFVVLSGGLFQLQRTGPATAVFWVRQLERLAAAQIPVYWAGGPDDTPDDWPATFTLPPNVHFFPSDTVQEFLVEGTQGQGPIARLLGTSRNHRDPLVKIEGFTPDIAGLFTVGVVHGELDPFVLDTAAIPFWAMGGRPQRGLERGVTRRPVARAAAADGRIDRHDDRRNDHRDAKSFVPVPYLVHYAGSTIARTPRSTGDFGATLVEVETNVQPRLTFIPTSPLRWIVERIALTDETTETTLAHEVAERMTRLQETAARTATDTLVTFRLTETRSDHPLFVKLRSTPLADEMLQRWRLIPSGLLDASANTTALAWPGALEIDTPETLPPPLYDQQTILGDYLRLVRHHQSHPEIPIDLAGLLPPGVLSQSIASRLLLCQRPSGSASEPTEPTNESAEIETASALASSPETESPSQTAVSQTVAQQRRQLQILREAALLGSELLGQNRTVF